MRNYCKDCPMYWNACDYWGEWDEGCEAHLDGWFDGKDHTLICKMPNFIKTIYLKYLRWKEERYWKKHIKEWEENDCNGECNQCEHKFSCLDSEFYC